MSPWTHPTPKHPLRGDSLSISSRIRRQAKYGSPDTRCFSKQIFLEKTIWQRRSRASSKRGSFSLQAAQRKTPSPAEETPV